MHHLMIFSIIQTRPISWAIDRPDEWPEMVVQSVKHENAFPKYPSREYSVRLYHRECILLTDIDCPRVERLSFDEMALFVEDLEKRRTGPPFLPESILIIAKNQMRNNDNVGMVFSAWAAALFEWEWQWISWWQTVMNGCVPMVQNEWMNEWVDELIIFEQFWIYLNLIFNSFEYGFIIYLCEWNFGKSLYVYGVW